MNIRKGIVALIPVVIFSCGVVPTESIVLSKKIGEDLLILHSSHINSVDMQFNKMIADINSFVDDVYGPYVIHHVLQAELQAFKNKRHSIYGVIDTAGRFEGKRESNAALTEMSDFVVAAREQIEEKRKDLVEPVLAQRTEVLTAVNRSYQNVIFANATITHHLESLRKVKDAQKEALKTIGLENFGHKVTSALVKASDNIHKAIIFGEKIDVKSDDALKKLDSVSFKIKSAFNKVQ